MAGTITITGTVTGSPTGTETFTIALPVAGTGPNTQGPTTLSQPSGTIPVPTGARYLHFTPPPGNQILVFFEGTEMHLTLPQLLAFDTARTVVNYTVSDTVMGCEIRWY